MWNDGKGHRNSTHGHRRESRAIRLEKVRHRLALVLASLCLVGILGLALPAFLVFDQHTQSEGVGRIRIPETAGAREPKSPLPEWIRSARSPEETNLELFDDLFPHFFKKESLKKFDILIVGAGLSGTVLADIYARKHNKRVLVLERRPHIGGNCFDFREKHSGILMNLYGAHLFHTNKNDVWEYIHRFSEWVPYEHRVVGKVDGKLVPIPVNIDTVNLLTGSNIQSVEEMKKWLATERNMGKDGIGTEPLDSRTIGISRVGKRLYQKIFREYTKKQWNVYPEDLGPEVLARIPVREDWDDRYFPSDKFQALPAFGYTKWFEEALDHPNIKVLTSIDYFSLLSSSDEFRKKKFERTFFTGQIDQFFLNKGANLKPLQYRSIRFEAKLVQEPSVWQPSFVVNSPQFSDGAFTRTVEYKHMYFQNSSGSVLVREFSTDPSTSQEPYYPFPTEENQKQFAKYQELAREEEEKNKVFFVGRLANYKYFNMDDALDNVLKLYRKIEGKRSMLSSVLEEGRSKITTGRLPNAQVVIFVDSPAPTFSWIPALCKRSSHFKLRFFLYNVGNFSFSSLGKISDILSATPSCPKPRIGENVVFRDALSGILELNIIDHLSRSSFSFGDLNAFLRESSGDEIIHNLLQAFDLQYTVLYQSSVTMASDENVRSKNFRALKASWLLLSQEQLRDLRWYSIQSVGTKTYPETKNLFHLLPLSEKGLLTTADNWKPSVKLLKTLDPTIQSILSECPVSLPTLEIAVTDAALRRMLSVHRNFLLTLQTVLERVEIHEFRQLLLRIWYCLFFVIEDNRT